MCQSLETFPVTQTKSTNEQIHKITILLFSQAVKHLIRAAQSTSTEDSESIQMAIDVIAAANDDGLTRQLIDFLMGEVDGIPKVRLYH